MATAFPTADNVHTDVPLTNFLLAYHPEGFVADKVFPILPVKHETDLFYRWAAGDMVRKVDGLRADGAAAKVVDFQFDSTTYTARQYSLVAKITDRQRDNSDDQLRLVQTKIQAVKDLLLLQRELAVMTLLGATSGTYFTKTDAASTCWDATTTYIEKDIDAAKTSVRQNTNGREANVIVIPPATAIAAKRSSELRDLIRYTHSDLLDVTDLPPNLFGLKVIQPRAVENTADTGQGTDVIADVFGDKVFVGYMNANMSQGEVTAGCIFEVAKLSYVKHWREEKLASDMYEVSMGWAVEKIADGAGYRITDTET